VRLDCLKEIQLDCWGGQCCTWADSCEERYRFPYRDCEHCR